MVPKLSRACGCQKNGTLMFPVLAEASSCGSLDWFRSPLLSSDAKASSSVALSFILADQTTFRCLAFNR